MLAKHYTCASILFSSIAGYTFYEHFDFFYELRAVAPISSFTHNVKQNFSL